MALLKIESVSLGVNSASQERARTEVSVSCCEKQQYFFCAEVNQVYQHSLGKNTSFSVNTKSVFVKQACRYSKLLHFSSTAFDNRNHTHLAFILHSTCQGNSIHVNGLIEAIRVLTYISVCCVQKALLAVE